MTNSDLKIAMQQAGARFAEQTSDRPLHFGSSKEEHIQHGKAALLFDLPKQTLLEVTGADRAVFIQKFCTNDIVALPPGRWCEAFVTDINSHVIAHLQIYAEAEALWITTADSCGEAVWNHFDRYIFNDDIAFHNRSDDYELLFLSGKKSAQLLSELNTIELNAHYVGELTGMHCAVSRVDRLQEPGFLIRIPHTDASTLWQGLVAAGASPAGNLVYESLRIAAGWPVDGIDIPEKTLAQEVGRTSQAISFNKGCYLGQEPIARIDALGHVNKTLCKLKIASSSLPEPRATICTTTSDKEIGYITSAAISYDDNQIDALCYLRRKELTEATQLLVNVNGTLVAAAGR